VAERLTRADAVREPSAGQPPRGRLLLFGTIAIALFMASFDETIVATAPGHAAAIAGLRGMFRQAGSITGVSVTAAIVARSADPGIAQAHVFLRLAAMLLCSLLLIPLIPEHRGRW
jgi:hypothetical protein